MPGPMPPRFFGVLAVAGLLFAPAASVAQTTPLIVNKAGIEARVFDFAHDQRALYGIIAILIALVAGWLAHVAFREA